MSSECPATSPRVEGIWKLMVCSRIRSLKTKPIQVIKFRPHVWSKAAGLGFLMWCGHDDFFGLPVPCRLLLISMTVKMLNILRSLSWEMSLCMSSILQRLLISQLHFWSSKSIQSLNRLRHRHTNWEGEGYCKGQNSFVLRREGFVHHRVLLTGSFSIVRTTSPNLPAFALLVLARPSFAVPAVSGSDELEAWW